MSGSVPEQKKNRNEHEHSQTGDGKVINETWNSPAINLKRKLMQICDFSATTHVVYRHMKNCTFDARHTKHELFNFISASKLISIFLFCWECILSANDLSGTSCFCCAELVKTYCKVSQPQCFDRDWVAFSPTTTPSVRLESNWCRKLVRRQFSRAMVQLHCCTNIVMSRKLNISKI